MTVVPVLVQMFLNNIIDNQGRHSFAVFHSILFFVSCIVMMSRYKPVSAADPERGGGATGGDALDRIRYYQSVLKDLLEKVPPPLSLWL